MKRIDILKGIEQILVQKAYETGHISHRADGDWQKQADGSWIPYRGQSSQSAPQAQEDSPTENTKYSEIVKQDFESVPKSIKDKMFTIAQQYQSEWAEDSDEDVRSMAENDVEDISQMLWDNADEETRNSWIGSEDSNKEDQYSEITEEDLKELDKKGLSQHLSNMHNQTIQSLLNDLENGKITEDQFKSQMSDLNNNITTSLNSLGNNGYESDDKNITNEEKTVVNPKMDWEGISMSSVDKPAQYILENLEDFEGEDMNGTIKTFVKGAGDREQQIIDTTKRYIQRQAESNGKKLTWYSDGTYSIEKSAIRDMRSVPTTKNMGF